MNSSLPLHIDDLVVSYDGRVSVVDRVTFDVRPGETFGLIGLNGQGKTTLIKAILGLREPKAGSISVFGQGQGDPAGRRRLSYLPERFDPPSFLCGIDFIRFAARFYDKTLSDSEILQSATDLGLDPAALPRMVQTYSKGMRQKLGLIATVMTGCDLLILDEPMSGLDPRARVQVKTLLTRMKTQGRTIFMSSHILSDMDEICDRVAVLHQGTLRYIGSPADLRAQTGDVSLEKAFLSVIEEKARAV